MNTETESSSSEDDDTETDEGYADAEFTNSSSGEEGDDEEWLFHNIKIKNSAPWITYTSL